MCEPPIASCTKKIATAKLLEQAGSVGRELRLRAPFYPPINAHVYLQTETDGHTDRQRLRQPQRRRSGGGAAAAAAENAQNLCRRIFLHLGSHSSGLTKNTEVAVQASKRRSDDESTVRMEGAVLSPVPEHPPPFVRLNESMREEFVDCDFLFSLRTLPIQSVRCMCGALWYSRVVSSRPRCTWCSTFQQYHST